MARAKASSIVRELHAEQPKRRKKQKKRPAATKDDALERVLQRVSAEPAPPPKREARQPGLRTARVVTAAGRAAEIVLRGERAPIVAAVAAEVEAEVLERAVAERETVLVEVVAEGPPVVVGIIQTRVAREVSLKGRKVEIEAEEEILLKTGRGALRIRQDGDIELVGSRVVAMSRGLFRLVGKMLRLN